MSDDTPAIPIRQIQAEVDLTSMERMKIAALEEYRIEIRRQLEERRPKLHRDRLFWLEKVVAPAVIVLLTAAISGYLIPTFLNSHERARYSSQVATGLVEEIAEETGSMEAAIDLYSDAVDSYWIDAARVNAIVGDYALRRDLGEISVEEFGRLDGLVENDRKRVHDRFDASAAEYDRELVKFRPWINRMRVRIRALYPNQRDRAELDTAFAKVIASVIACDNILENKHRAYESAINAEIERVKKSRGLFKTGAVSKQQYASNVSATLNMLRGLKEIEHQRPVLDRDSVAFALAFIERERPTVK